MDYALLPTGAFSERALFCALLPPFLLFCLRVAALEVGFVG